MAFSGFPEGGLAFFRQLAITQDREWFKAHKDAYELLWLKPMTSFVDELHAALKPSFPELKQVKPKIFRIYRDVRFSKNKTPFKTTISAVLPLFASGDRPEGATALYCEFGEEPFIAAGRWMMEPDLLKRFRKTVAEEKTGAPLARAVEKATKAGFGLSASGALKRAPPGFPKDHPRVELLKRKGFAFTFPTRSSSALRQGKLLRDVVADLKQVAPVVRWLEALARNTALPRL
jgi:uncharacterized protein (TIGR02453 family)